MLRVRFAPSPTGYLHVGGLRTALYDYLLARRHGGKFLLRIEDTDRNRLVADAVERFVSDLRWAGVVPDEGVSCQPEGPYGPYTQSQRLPIYRKYADELLEKGLAYRCFATAEELDRMRKESGGYDKSYRHLDSAEGARRAAQGEPHVIRMKVPEGETITFDDLIRGSISFETSVVDDQVILKSDGFPTYHLAAVVDDHLMGITHVIRGEEWLSSTPKHILLYRSLGWELPHFAHIPLIVNIDGKKLSKRDGDVSVASYIDQGFLPEGLVNFLALLGWSSGDEREIFTMTEMEQLFSLERVNNSPSVFDVNKLRHINQQHLLRMEPATIAARLAPWYAKLGVEMPEPTFLHRLIELMKPRSTLLPDFIQSCPYFYEDPTEMEASALKKRWKEDSPAMLADYAQFLQAVATWTREELEKALRELCESRGVAAGQLIHPTRLAISGVGGGPGLFEMMELLGRETCLRRLARAPQLAR